jgi:hypothetical protein
VSSSLTYVYCLVRAHGRPSLRGVPPPVPGGRPVRLLEVPDADFRRAVRSRLKPKAQGLKPKLWLVVSSVPARRYDETTLDDGLQHLDWVGARALAHEAVVEHFLSESAVLPMRLFALFASDERAIQHVTREHRRIARILARIGGRVEWGLRVTLSHPVQGSDPRTTRHRGLTPVSGAAYLAHKRNLREAKRTRVAQARRDAERVYRAIRRTTVAAKRRTAVERTSSDTPVVLDAAFLVPTRRGQAFRASVHRHSRPLQRAGMEVSLTGPWPAYNFI